MHKDVENTNTILVVTHINAYCCKCTLHHIPFHPTLCYLVSYYIRHWHIYITTVVYFVYSIQVCPKQPSPGKLSGNTKAQLLLPGTYEGCCCKTSTPSTIYVRTMHVCIYVCPFHTTAAVRTILRDNICTKMGRETRRAGTLEEKLLVLFMFSSSLLILFTIFALFTPAPS